MRNLRLDNAIRTPTCWSCWRSAKIHMNCTHECSVTPISKWCDDKPSRVSEVFIAIQSLRIYHAHYDSFLWMHTGGRKLIEFPIVPAQDMNTDCGICCGRKKLRNDVSFPYLE